MLRVEIKPEMLRWAVERSGRDADKLYERFPKLDAWESGDAQPTFKQVEDFAKATYTPFGYFFLAEPPQEQVPIPDFRTIANADVGRPSPDLLDTLHLCQQRQEWYRDFVRSNGEDTLTFIGSTKRTASPVKVAASIRQTLSFDLAERRQLRTWEDALRHFIERVDMAGIMVMVSGIVGSNTRRKLNPDEFRGFALSDPLAPLIFINGSDTKSAQMFTLAHELAHLWIGETALTDAGPATTTNQRVEVWCNQVAAEILVPLDAFKQEYRPSDPIERETQRLAKSFKVSTLVILRRMLDAGGLSRDEFWSVYNTELGRLRSMNRKSSGGGDFYRTMKVKVGGRFARALMISTLEGHTLQRDAFRMLSIKKTSTFNELGRQLGVPI